jgi:Flp pilus assembly protein TadG
MTRPVTRCATPPRNAVPRSVITRAGLRRAAAARGEEGAAAVLLLVLTPALFGLAGLVLDGGRQLSARQQAADLAEQGARAGADRLDITQLRATSTAQGAGALDVRAAKAVACRYVTIADPAATCTATVDDTADGPRLTVGVRTSSSTVLLGLIGVNHLHTDATGSALAVTGIRTTLGRTRVGAP